MVHADIFQRVEKNPQANRQVKAQPQVEADQELSTIETLKILGEEILSLRQATASQDDKINKLEQEILSLRKQNKEIIDNFKLTRIDQKDLAKQMRILKSELSTNDFINQRTNIYQNDNLETNKIPENFYANYNESQVVKNNQAAQDLRATLAEIQKPRAIKETSATKQEAFDSEEIAKEFIFGRIPKVLNLD